MQLEIAPQHHLFIIGRGGANVKHIMQQTGATIHFPDPSTSQPQRKGTVFITGPIESVYLARSALIVSHIYSLPDCIPNVVDNFLKLVDYSEVGVVVYSVTHSYVISRVFECSLQKFHMSHYMAFL